MNRCLPGAYVPEWMTTLIQKGPPEKNRPLQLQTHNLPTDDVKNINSTNKYKEHKGCRLESRGTGELFYIDQHICNVNKTENCSYGLALTKKKRAYDMVTQSWIINCLKMYKISHEAINFIVKTMKIWKGELTAGGRSLIEAMVQRVIFQGEALSPLLFIIAMMPLNRILKKCTNGYKLSRSQEKINHLMYMDDIKLFAIDEKDLEPLIQPCENIQSGHWVEFSIKECHASSEKRQTMPDGRNGTTKSRQN